jgi:hypothetical protein
MDHDIDVRYVLAKEVLLKLAHRINKDLVEIYILEKVKCY